MVRYFQIGPTEDNLEDVAYPTSVKWSYNEISSDKSGRAKSGKMNKRVVAVKRKIACTWKMLEDEAASALLSKLKAKTYIYLKYMDPFEGQDITKRFYTDDPDAECEFRSSDKKYYWTISINFIEQ